jgi:uncharacterized membrane protein
MRFFPLLDQYWRVNRAQGNSCCCDFGPALDAVGGAIVGAGAGAIIGGAPTGRPEGAAVGAVTGANAERRYRSRERPIFLRN